MKKNNIKENPTNKKVILKIKIKMIVNIFLICFLLIGSLFLVVIANNIEFDDSELIYSGEENSLVDYSVNLKKNSFYESSVLGMNQQYPAYLTNSIDLKIDYNLKFSKVLNYSYNYYATESLYIYDKTDSINEKLLLKRDYQLENPITGNSQSDNYVFNKTYNIDYNKYNNFVNQYKNNLGVSVNSYLKVTFYVCINSSYNSYNKSSNKLIEVTIPLNTSTYNIAVSNSKDSSFVVENTNVKTVRSKIFTFIALLMFLVGILLFIQEIRSVLSSDKEQSRYISKLNKIISSNGDVIVKVKNKPNLKGLNIMEVESIEKLLDVQNELRIPIAFYEEEKNKRGIFVVVNGNEAWEFILKISKGKTGNK